VKEYTTISVSKETAELFEKVRDYNNMTSDELVKEMLLNRTKNDLVDVEKQIKGDDL
jgi:hypothetical protein